MTTQQDNPSTLTQDPQVEPVRGGITTSFIKTTQNVLTRTAELGAPNEARAQAFKGYDPMRPVKNITSLATVATIADQAALAFGRGDYTKSAEYTAQDALILSTAVPQARDTVIRQAVKVPAIKAAGEGISNTLEKMTVKVALKEGVASAIPFASPVMDMGYGSVAAGRRYVNGDAVGAKGDELVAAVGATTYTAAYGATLGGVIVGGTAACAFTGPVAPACEAGVIAAAPFVASTTAHATSEVAKQLTANVYNAAYNNPTDNPNFTEGTRGSTEYELAKYAYERRGSAKDLVDQSLTRPANSERTSSHEPHSSDYRPRYENPSTNAPVIAKYDPAPDSQSSAISAAADRKLDQLVRDRLAQERINNASAGAKGLVTGSSSTVDGPGHSSTSCAIMAPDCKDTAQTRS